MKNSMADLASFINCNVVDSDICALLNELLMKKLSSQFMTAPAACNKHHNYPGGLLEHSLSVARNTNSIVNKYREGINSSIALAGALLHDIGKVACYEQDGTTLADSVSNTITYKRTYLDEYIGHISEGYRLVINAGEYLNLPKDKVEQIGHIIIASHGKKEWGSPVEPKTREAFIVHQADMIDAYLTGWEQCNEKKNQ